MNKESECLCFAVVEKKRTGDSSWQTINTIMALDIKLKVVNNLRGKADRFCRLTFRGMIQHYPRIMWQKTK